MPQLIRKFDSVMKRPDQTDSLLGEQRLSLKIRNGFTTIRKPVSKATTWNAHWVANVSYLKSLLAASFRDKLLLGYRALPTEQMRNTTTVHAETYCCLFVCHDTQWRQAQLHNMYDNPNLRVIA